MIVWMSVEKTNNGGISFWKPLNLLFDEWLFGSQWKRLIKWYFIMESTGFADRCMTVWKSVEKTNNWGISLWNPLDFPMDRCMIVWKTMKKTDNQAFYCGIHSICMIVWTSVEKTNKVVFHSGNRLVVDGYKMVWKSVEKTNKVAFHSRNFLVWGRIYDW